MVPGIDDSIEKGFSDWKKAFLLSSLLWASVLPGVTPHPQGNSEMGTLDGWARLNFF